MEKYAYIRVSTKEQNIDRQLVALKPYGIPEQNIYCDYQSGKDFDRPAYKKLLGKLKRGDLLIVKSIDRFLINLCKFFLMSCSTIYITDIMNDNGAQ